MLLLLVQQKLSNLTIDKRNKDGISVKEEMEWTRQTKGSGYDLGYQKTALSKEANAESREVRCLIQAFKTKYEHVGPKVTSVQEATRSQDDDKRFSLDDDLKEVQVHIQVKPIRTSSSLKSKLTMPYSQDDVKKTNLRAQD
ncbi:hypothetical protein Tco_0052027 [Tanacetum coccineum]